MEPNDTSPCCKPRHQRKKRLHEETKNEEGFHCFPHRVDGNFSCYNVKQTEIHTMALRKWQFVHRRVLLREPNVGLLLFQE